MMYGYYDSYPFYMFGFGFVIMIIFWIIVIAIFFRLFRSLWPRNSRGWHARSSALEILRERYAKGEITKEQFQEMRKELEIE